ncbi:hypothetical protein FNU76_10255 [Chitinimonas arctica]|uniref:Uncharacterized protein n=1 Tax=Chitinimonas arctica TaxID=2594795 RepID=A0A516SEY1_9NEIS|nr:hypothetical protein [Chitinimonas arctica]QDQ26715.1 hypothetical protein FNU76_10255 [Chitinimonas arctica]
MIVISINTSGFATALAEHKQKAVRCTAIALTRTAGHAQRQVQATMPRVFDRPTPYTLRGMRVKPARANLLQAEVTFKDDTFKGTPAEKYLGPEVFGGARRLKRFERALQAKGLMPAGMVAVPGEAMQLDSFGNMRGSEIVKLLSQLQAFGEQGYRANATDGRLAKLKQGTRTRQGFELIVVKPGQKPARGGKALPAGIWRRTYTAFGTSLQPLVLFVRSATYQRRLDLPGIADQAAQAHLQDEFNLAFRS